jgi:hypothetical protein
MNTIFQQMELGNQRLEQLHHEMQVLRMVRECTGSTGQTHLSIRRRLARFLRHIARSLDRAELKLGRA